MDFSQFDLHPDLLDGIEALNFTTPTPIQQQAIPLILEGRDLIGTAQTGTGKTAAFILPILNQILDSGESGFTQALVLVPTRELAVQIGKVVDAYSYFTGISCMPIYGGSGGNDFSQEKTAITTGTDIIVATPGRFIAHINLGYVKLADLRFLVLDEADRMLDMGFMPDIQKIISNLPTQRQTLLFSATMPSGVLKLTKTILKDPAMVKIALSKPAEGVTQGAYLVRDDNQKMALIANILKEKTGQRIIIFGSSRASVNSLYKSLRARQFAAERISSDLEQADREQVMLDFRSRKIDILVATDVLSRGIDVEGIDLVINFDVPHDAEDYVHRIGRTARAERKGEALTLISPKDGKRFASIEKLIGKIVEKRPLPDGIGNGPGEEDMRRGGPTRREGSGGRQEQPRNRRPDGSKRPPQQKSAPAPKLSEKEHVAPPTDGEATPKNPGKRRRKKRRSGQKKTGPPTETQA